MSLAARSHLPRQRPNSSGSPSGARGRAATSPRPRGTKATAETQHAAEETDDDDGDFPVVEVLVVSGEANHAKERESDRAYGCGLSTPGSADPAPQTGELW